LSPSARKNLPLTYKKCSQLIASSRIHLSFQTKAHILPKQTQTLTECGGGSHPGHSYPNQGSSLGSLCSGTPIVLTKISLDWYHGLRHSQVDSVPSITPRPMPDQRPFLILFSHLHCS
jgi:hypothetical protein